jgi:hypothetical protein
LSVEVDNQPVSAIDERTAASGTQEENDVWIGNLAPGTHTLSFRLDPFTDVHSIVSISNVQFGLLQQTTSTYEPPTPPASTTAALVQSATGITYTGATTSIVFANDVTAGDLLAIGMASGPTPNSFTSVSATCATDPLTVAADIPTNNSIEFGLAYGIVTDSGPCTITITTTNPVGTEAVAHEISGIDPADPLDASSTFTSPSHDYGSDPFSSGTSTTSADGDYIFGYELGGASLPMTAGEGFTIETSTLDTYSEDMIQSSAGPAAASFIPSDDAVYTAGMMAFRPTASVNVQGFSISPDALHLGSSTMLFWDVENASSVTITGNDLDFTTSTLSGTLSVTPDATGTLTYTLTAVNPNDTRTVEQTEQVIGPGVVLVQTGTGITYTGATTTIVFDNDVAEGDLLAVGMASGPIPNSFGSVTATCITDPLTVAADIPNDSSNVEFGLAYGVVTDPGPCTITITTTNPVGTEAISHEVSGIDVTNPLDTTSTLAADFYANDPFSSGTSTTSADGDYIFGYEVGGQNIPMTPGDGFTLETSTLDAYSEDMTQSAAGPISAAFNPDGDATFTAGMMAFKPEE